MAGPSPFCFPDGSVVCGHKHMSLWPGCSHPGAAAGGRGHENTACERAAGKVAVGDAAPGWDLQWDGGTDAATGTVVQVPRCLDVLGCHQDQKKLGKRHYNGEGSQNQFYSLFFPTANIWTPRRNYWRKCMKINWKFCESHWPIFTKKSFRWVALSPPNQLLWFPSQVCPWKTV